jgi:hypothetical protein
MLFACIGIPENIQSPVYRKSHLMGVTKSIVMNVFKKFLSYLSAIV